MFYTVRHHQHQSHLGFYGENDETKGNQTKTCRSFLIPLTNFYPLTRLASFYPIFKTNFLECCRAEKSWLVSYRFFFWMLSFPFRASLIMQDGFFFLLPHAG